MNKVHEQPPINIMGAIITQPAKKVDYTINVDWFEATVIGGIVPSYSTEVLETISYDDCDIVLKHTGKGSKHYQHIYSIYFAGDKEKFATIQTSPRSKVLDPLSSIIKVDNHCLYSDGWTSKFKYLIDVMGLRVNNITRLDIATDGRGFRSTFERVDNGDLSIVGRAKMSAEGTETASNGKRTADSYRYGSSSSPKQISVYSKGLSLEEQNKQYIGEFWIKNGLISEYEQRKEIERAELRLKRKAINQIIDNEMIDETTGEVFTGVNISRLEDSTYLASIKKAHMKSYCEFVSTEEKEQKGNVTRCKVIPLIDWSKLNTKQMERLSTTQKPSTVWRAKRCSSFLLELRNNETPITKTIHNHLVRKGFNISESELSGLAEKLAKSIAEKYGFSEYINGKLLQERCIDNPIQLRKVI